MMEVIEECGGNLALACKKMCISYQKLYYIINKNPELKKSIAILREQVLDFAEDNLYKAIKAGDIGTSKWILAKLGSNRGYAEKINIVSQNLNFDAQVDLESLSEEELERLNELLIKITKTDADTITVSGTGTEGVN